MQQQAKKSNDTEYSESKDSLRTNTRDSHV